MPKSTDPVVGVPPQRIHPFTAAKALIWLGSDNGHRESPYKLAAASPLAFVMPRETSRPTGPHSHFLERRLRGSTTNTLGLVGSRWNNPNNPGAGHPEKSVDARRRNLSNHHLMQHGLECKKWDALGSARSF